MLRPGTKLAGSEQVAGLLDAVYEEAVEAMLSPVHRNFWPSWHRRWPSKNLVSPVGGTSRVFRMTASKPERWGVEPSHDPPPHNPIEIFGKKYSYTFGRRPNLFFCCFLVILVQKCARVAERRWLACAKGEGKGKV